VHAGLCPPHTEKPAEAGLSKLSSKRSVVVDVDLGELGHGRRTACHRRAERPPEYKSSGIPRKEVIQPQLPLRLPCYDFTPIIDPTFDGCLPYGLAHRLRVLPTFVV
jgi:hypothetical protein